MFTGEPLDLETPGGPGRHGGRRQRQLPGPQRRRGAGVPGSFFGAET